MGFKRVNKIKTLKMYGMSRLLDPPTQPPSRMGKCKYELWANGTLRRVVTTDMFNREVVLKTLCEWADTCKWFDYHRRKPLPYSIYVIENGARELLIYSTNPNHRLFIDFLCGKQEKSTLP